MYISTKNDIKKKQSNKEQIFLFSCSEIYYAN